ncbi:MAG: GGDEF domain-containing phosphodiesterase [Acidocella sp.]|nr:GGDEF domain-containing phosphodiesterase [Acidocella sp.]
MQTSAELRHRRLDPITCLPNREQFMLDYRCAPGTDLIKMTISDDTHFNQLLRTIGHDCAEDFLRAGAQRLGAVLPSSATLYHIGSLSFVFTLPAKFVDDQLATVVELFHKPVVCAGIPITTDIAIGVVECTDPNPAVTLRAAFAAVQDSRDAGQDWARYDHTTDFAHMRSFLLLSHLTAALDANDQLSLHFQPKYDMASGRITSAEALIRWDHPEYGPISPAEFVPLAETTAHIHALTSWVLRRAIAQAGAWAAKGSDINIAINISPRNLTRRGFAAQTSEILKYYGVEPSMIELEFTEGSVVGNDSIVLEELTALRSTGIRIALDDFGTGFANFSYITHFPADIIKIDKCFIQKISTDPRSAQVVRSLIELAHKLNYRVVAEGIETEKTYTMLAAWNCDEGQGFFMSKPLSATHFSEKIRHGAPSLVIAL